MSYRAIKGFPHQRLGYIPKGGEITDPKEGERLRRMGLVVLYDTKVVRPEPKPVNPPQAVGETSSASPVAPASQQTTSKRSGPGAKRPRKKAQPAP